MIIPHTSICTCIGCKDVMWPLRRAAVAAVIAAAELYLLADSSDGHAVRGGCRHTRHITHGTSHMTHHTSVSHITLLTPHSYRTRLLLFCGGFSSCTKRVSCCASLRTWPCSHARRCRLLLPQQQKQQKQQQQKQQQQQQQKQHPLELHEARFLLRQPPDLAMFACASFNTLQAAPAPAAAAAAAAAAAPSRRRR
jgi:hypothetical protein